MNAQEIGEHDPMLVTCEPRLGWWVECECGWIGPGNFTKNRALESHAAHVARANEHGDVR